MRRLAGLALLAVSTSGCIGFLSSDSDVSIDGSELLAHIEYFAADSLFGRRAGSIHELQAAQYIRSQFVDYGVSPAVPQFFQGFPVVGGKFAVGPPCSLSPLQGANPVSQNVLGRLPGSGDLAGQWVVVSAHYDHLGCRDDPGRTVVFPGADDNASGTAVMLELARIVASEETDPDIDRRSVLFAAFGAEEPGLIGSDYFVANPHVPIDSIVAVLNLDMVGRLRNSELTVAGTTAAEGWELALESQNEGGLRFRYNDAFLLRGDHYSFILAGVPSVHLFTGQHSDYHTEGDVVAGINEEGLVAVGELTRRVLRSLRVQARIPQPR